MQRWTANCSRRRHEPDPCRTTPNVVIARRNAPWRSRPVTSFLVEPKPLRGNPRSLHVVRDDESWGSWRHPSAPETRPRGGRMSPTFAAQPQTASSRGAQRRGDLVQSHRFWSNQNRFEATRDRFTLFAMTNRGVRGNAPARRGAARRLPSAPSTRPRGGRMSPTLAAQPQTASSRGAAFSRERSVAVRGDLVQSQSFRATRDRFTLFAMTNRGAHGNERALHRHDLLEAA